MEKGVEPMKWAEHVDSNVFLQWKRERGSCSSEEGVVRRRVGNLARTAWEGNYTGKDHESKVGVGRPHVEGAVTIGLTSTYA